MTHDLIAVALAYLLGCIQTGYYLVRTVTRQDLRCIGSGSTGARNAGRVLGRKGFILTLIGDAGKGALAVVLAGWLGASPIAMAAAMVAVSVGHVWPIQLRFSGGRGVAVGLGSLAVFDLRLLAVLTVVTLLVYAVSRRFQAGGLAGFASLPAAAWCLRLTITAQVGVLCLVMIVLFSHRSHIAGWLKPIRNEGGTPTIKL